jgi:LPS export ABC transporter protein LptC
VIGINACSRPDWIFRQSAPKPEAKQQVEGSLTFQNIILKQTNAEGQLLWQIKAKQATYRNNQKAAQIKEIQGNLYQGGKAAFKVEAEQGEVQQDGQKVVLKGKIIATDLQDGVVLKGREVEWRPQEDLLTVRKDLTVIHAQIQMWAREARASSRTHQVVAQGQVVAETRSPVLRLRTERVVWQIAQQQISTDLGQGSSTPRGIEIQQFVNKTISNRAYAGEAKVNLKTNIVTFQAPAEISLLNPPLDVSSQQLRWDVNRQLVISDRPVQVSDRRQKVTLTANQGYLNQSQQLVQLTGAVRAEGWRNRSVLTTDQLTWLLPNQQIEARGHVFYQQEESPRFSLKGPRAIGRIQEQTILISGGGVVTEIFP